MAITWMSALTTHDPSTVGNGDREWRALFVEHRGLHGQGILVSKDETRGCVLSPGNGNRDLDFRSYRLRAQVRGGHRHRRADDTSFVQHCATTSHHIGVGTVASGRQTSPFVGRDDHALSKEDPLTDFDRAEDQDQHHWQDDGKLYRGDSPTLGR